MTCFTTLQPICNTVLLIITKEKEPNPNLYKDEGEKQMEKYWILK